MISNVGSPMFAGLERQKELVKVKPEDLKDMLEDIQTTQQALSTFPSQYKKDSVPVLTALGVLDAQDKLSLNRISKDRDTSQEAVLEGVRDALNEERQDAEKALAAQWHHSAQEGQDTPRGINTDNLFKPFNNAQEEQDNLFKLLNKGNRRKINEVIESFGRPFSGYQPQTETLEEVILQQELASSTLKKGK